MMRYFFHLNDPFASGVRVDARSIHANFTLVQNHIINSCTNSKEEKHELIKKKITLRVQAITGSWN